MGNVQKKLSWINSSHKWSLLSKVESGGQRWLKINKLFFFLNCYCLKLWNYSNIKSCIFSIEISQGFF